VTSSRLTSRRSLLGAAAVAGGGVLASATPARGSEAADRRAAPVRESFKVVDKRGRQAFLVSTRKPEIIMPGQMFPPEARGGPDPATYLIFNDENGAEKGGLCASATAASFSLDYHNAQAITLATEWQGEQGGAALIMQQMPDPDLPPDQASAPHRIRLGCYTQIGAMLALNDSRGRPRIVLEVDKDDVPRIKILDESGEVVSELT
jgi:hypothetical protein